MVRTSYNSCNRVSFWQLIDHENHIIFIDPFGHLIDFTIRITNPLEKCKEINRDLRCIPCFIPLFFVFAQSHKFLRRKSINKFIGGFDLFYHADHFCNMFRR
jgi:hypothetical protein